MITTNTYYPNKMDYHDHHHHQNCTKPRILNFNAPLLSTRRAPNSAASVEYRRNSTASGDDRIPFSWEKAPGKPKNDTYTTQNDNEDDTPRPKLPPGLWRIRQTAACNEENDNINGGDDEGCDADVENDDDDDEDDVNDRDDIFSDAVDVFSLSEAIDILERSEKARENLNGDQGLRMKIMEDNRSRSDYHQYPDFIIQRFLPDATALATASALGAMSLKQSCNNYNGEQARLNSTSTSTSTSKSKKVHPHSTTTTSFSSLKGCGFDMLFPWRVKHRLCGVKSPVRRGCSTTTTHSHTTSMHLKHKKHTT